MHQMVILLLSLDIIFYGIIILFAISNLFLKKKLRKLDGKKFLNFLYRIEKHSKSIEEITLNLKKKRDLGEKVLKYIYQIIILLVLFRLPFEIETIFPHKPFYIRDMGKTTNILLLGIPFLFSTIGVSRFRIIWEEIKKRQLIKNEKREEF